MDSTQNFDDSNSYSSTSADNTSNTNAAQDNAIVLDTTLSSNNSSYPQETVGLTEYSFFYKPPNDFQIYNIICKETPISFELVSQLLNNNNNNYYTHSNNSHEFHFLKPDKKKCYKI